MLTFLNFISPNSFLFQPPLGAVTRAVANKKGGRIRAVRFVQLEHALINGQYRTRSCFRYKTFF